MAKYMTRQRRALLSYLGAHPDELLSVRNIADALTAEALSQSAVYRNLSDLEREGLVRRSHSGAGREVYYQYVGADECRGCLHLSCKKCGKTFHMGAEGAARILSVVAAAEGFTVDKEDTVLYGVCESCGER